MHWSGRIYIENALVENEIVTKNGHILIVDHVLIPYYSISDMLFMLSPYYYGTTSAALYHTGLAKTLKETKGLTMFAPTNTAWKSLCPETLFYLFSPCGVEDLKKILLTHIVKDLKYANDLLTEKGSTKKLRTMNEDEEIEIMTVKKGLHPRMLVNKEGRVIWADNPAMNGVVHTLSSVLIPSNVKLPSKGARLEGGLTPVMQQLFDE
jgi:uncharacterized surface protein with fasciclin (FAS1) repeats